jgi:hypothetical protein
MSRRLYKTGFGSTTGFIGSQYSYSVHTLQLATVDHYTRLATAPLPVFHCTVSSRLSLYSSGPRTSCRPTHCLRAHWLAAIPLSQPGPSIHLLARTHQPPNQDWTKTVFTAAVPELYSLVLDPKENTALTLLRGQPLPSNAFFFCWLIMPTACMSHYIYCVLVVVYDNVAPYIEGGSFDAFM